MKPAGFKSAKLYRILVLACSGAVLVLFTNAASPSQLSSLVTNFENSPQGQRLANSGQFDLSESIPLILEFLRANPTENAKVPVVISEMSNSLTSVGFTVQPIPNMGLTVTGGSSRLGSLIADLSSRASTSFLVSPFTVMAFSQTRAVAVNYNSKINLLQQSLPMLYAADFNGLGPTLVHEGLHAVFNTETNAFHINNSISVADFAAANFTISSDVTAQDGYNGVFSSSEAIAYLYETRATMRINQPADKDHLLLANEFANLACYFANQIVNAAPADMHLWLGRQGRVHVSMKGKASQLLVGKREDFPGINFRADSLADLPVGVRDRVRIVAENAYASYEEIRTQTLNSEFNGIAGYSAAVRAQDSSYATKGFRGARPVPVIRARTEAANLVSRAENILDAISDAAARPNIIPPPSSTPSTTSQAASAPSAGSSSSEPSNVSNDSDDNASSDAESDSDSDSE